MLLRTLWSRLGAQRPVERNPVFMCASASFSQSVQPHKYESKPRTHSSCSGPGIFSRTCYLNTFRQQQKHVRHALPALGLSSALLTDPGMLSKCRSEQKRLYSPDIVKSILKPSVKPAAVPGKRVPKGPRTKQPSRANQPALNEDKVIHQMSDWSHLMRSTFLFWWSFKLNPVSLCRIWCSVLPSQQQISIIYRHFATTWCATDSRRWIYQEVRL